MEHHRRLGIAPHVRDLCLPINRPTDVSYYTSLTGWELGRIPHAVGGRQAARRRRLRRDRPDARAAAPRQPDVRRGVPAGARAHAARTSPSASAGRSTGFDEDADGVTVEAEPTGGGARETWRAQYLAGCDGGRSFVRRSLALRYNGFASLDSPHYGGRQNATYFRAPTLYRDHLAHRPGWNYWMVNPEGPLHHHLAQRRRGVPGVLQGARRRRAADRRGACASMHRAPSAPNCRSRSSATGRGPPAWRWSPNASSPAAWCWPATPCICSRRPAASA